MLKGFLKKMGCLLLAGNIILGGCGVSDSPNGESHDENDDIEIGMCFDSFVIERWQKDRDVFVDTAKNLGATVNVQNANGDVDKQIEQIEYLIEKNVDCLVIVPIDGDALSEVIKEARDKDIPVVCYDRLISDANADLYISFDNQAVGTMMGETLAAEGINSVVMICGPLTDNNVPMVIDAFTQVMNENNITVIDSYYCDGWKAELGSAYVYDNMDTINQADALMCGNDDVATAVIRALAVSQLAGVKPVVGQDADLTACQHIVEGTQLMTVYKPVGKLAEQAAELSVELALGNDITVDATLNDGTYDIPYVAVEPIAVTAENMDEVIIDSGFHTREDVYMNVEE